MAHFNELTEMMTSSQEWEPLVFEPPASPEQVAAENGAAIAERMDRFQESHMSDTFSEVV